MRYCPECRTSVGSAGERCPLCGAVLTVSGEDSAEERLYPDFSAQTKKGNSFPFLAKLFAYLSLLGVSVCTLVNLLTAHQLSWSLYVTGGVITCWLTVGLHLLLRINLNYMLLIDTCAVSLYMILIDRLSGWHGWSVDWVIPITYIGIMITTVILALVFRVYWREYILSLIAVCVLGIAPLLIFFNRQTPIRFLCLAAALLGAALLIGILFFARGKLFSEWHRRMNL